MDKKFKFAPLILISLGVIFLLNNFCVLPWSIWINLWKFWPIILILIGVEFFIGQPISFRTVIILLVLIFLIPIVVAFNPLTKNPFLTQKIKVSKPIKSLTKARLLINLPTTNLSIKRWSDTTKLIEGEISFSQAANKPKIEYDEISSQAIVRISQPQNVGLPFISSLKNNTNLYLTTQIPLELQVDTAAANERLDLTGLRADYLELNSQATNLEIKFDSIYSSRAKIKTKATNIKIQIPEKMAARIKIDSTIKNLTINKRFKKSGDEYKTKDFDASFVRLDISIESIAGTISIR